MTKLHEVVAVEADVRKQTQAEKTRIYQNVQKTSLYFGSQREYLPLDDDGEKLPPKSEKVQRSLDEDMVAFRKVCERRIDLVATKDFTNTTAFANIEIDGQVLAENVPVTMLLWLEKELHDTRTELKALPTLPLDKEWTWNESSRQFLTPKRETARSTKIKEPVLLIAPTTEHPGQAELVSKDVNVGYWSARDISTALPENAKKALLDKLATLLGAVKAARTRANEAEVKQVKIAGALFDYLGI